MNDWAYLGFLLLGALVAAFGFVLAWWRTGLPMKWQVGAFTVAAVISGLIGARIYATIEEGWQWGLAFSLNAGFRMPGAVVGLVLGLGIWRRVFLPKESVGLIGDLGCIAMQFGAAVVRLGCLAAGCCFGTVTTLPWAIQFPRGTESADVHSSMGWIRASDAFSLPVHPLQMYFLLVHLALALILTWLARRKSYDGQVLLVGVLLGQSGKAALEFFRQPVAGVPETHLQLVSVAIAGAAGLALLVLARVRSVPRDAGRKVDRCQPSAAPARNA